MAASTNKTVPTRASVTAFINAVENETRRNDAKVLLKMMQDICGEKPAMWGPSIIGFGNVHYKYDSGREGDMPKIGYSPRKAYLVLYLERDKALLSKLGKHKISVACLYINKLEDVNLAVLRQLITASWNHSNPSVC